ncbi:MAG: hypothetical protein C0598_05795 [Marinilabiliales bacterium]|nr:MAG: hypothetical protein C0598_05795 [Marinilabiliales bacterium]
MIMLDKIKHSEFLDFFSKYSELTKEPMFVVNSDYKVVYNNKTFENFVQKSNEDILGELFGNALNCMYITKGKNNCGNNYYCSLCNIRNTITKSFNDVGYQIKEEVVRDFKLNDEIIFRKLSLSSFSFKIDNKIHVAIIINDSDLVND